MLINLKICQNYKLIFSNLIQSLFVQITKCIFQIKKVYLFKLKNVFVSITKCIYPSYKKYFSKLQNVFVEPATFCIKLVHQERGGQIINIQKTKKRDTSKL